MADLQSLKDGLSRFVETTSHWSKAAWEWLKPASSKFLGSSIRAGNACGELLKVGYAKSNIHTIGYAGSLMVIAGSFLPIIVINTGILGNLYLNSSDTSAIFHTRAGGLCVLLVGISCLADVFWKSYKWLWVSLLTLSILLLSVSIMLYMENSFLYSRIDLVFDVLREKEPQYIKLINAAEEIFSNPIKRYVAKYMEWAWGLGVMYLGAILIFAYLIILNFGSKKTG